jgi:CheY-like chemotaxis protein
MTSVLRILIVEDEWLLALETQEALEGAGCLVVGPAMCVEEALVLLANEAVDAAILDVSLTGEMSFPIAEALMGRNIPFAFATGYLASDLPERYRSCRFLSKPVRATALIATLGLG